MSDAAPVPATAADLLEVLGLIRSVGLPTEGISDTFPHGYAVVRDDTKLLGVAGLEVYDEFGLLRSVAVTSDRRGRGLGRALVNDRLVLAKQQRLKCVYLLTTTAADYFRNLGFSVIERAKAHVSIQQSPEFVAICPASATCLSLSP